MRTARTGSGSLLLVLATVGSAGAQSPFTGTWVTHNFGEANVIDLRVDGNRVTGTISQPGTAYVIVDGTASDNTVSFRAGGGNRIATFTGRVEGERITFTRTVQVLRLPGGAGIFGTGGPMEFVAAREASGFAIPHALLGNWRENPQRATFDPGPAGPPPVSPFVRGFALRPAGWIAFSSVVVAPVGDPNPTFALMRADGRDYPLYNEATLTALAQDGSQSSVTRAFRVLNDRTFELINKTNGVVTNRRRLTVSADGNKLTEVDTVLDAQGRTIATNTLVSERLLPDMRPPTD